MKNTVVIVGAGLSGLIAAQKLAKLGIRTIVLEQGEDVGGRMATCRIGGGLADYGCQFFTARSPEFIALVEKWRNAGMVFVWSHGWSDGSLKRTLPDGHPRYAVRGGMQALVQYLARDVDDIRTGFNIQRISLRGDHWLLEPEMGEPMVAYHLLLTPPAPVSLRLLDAGGVTLSDEDRTALARIQYIPSLTAMFVVDGAVNLPEPGAIQRKDEDFAWIADNYSKGISSRHVVTLQANGRYSQQHFDDDEASIIATFTDVLKPYLAKGAAVQEVQLVRWRYALPVVTSPESYLKAQDVPPLYFAGDAFGGRGRVEGAVLSGLAAARALGQR